jgi:hypothetical protein
MYCSRSPSKRTGYRVWDPLRSSLYPCYLLLDSHALLFDLTVIGCKSIGRVDAQSRVVHCLRIAYQADTQLTDF